MPARYYEALVGLLSERGHPRARVLEGLDLPASRLEKDTSFLTLVEVERLVLRAIELEPSDALGLDLGRRLQLPSHGVVGMAGLTAPDLAGAIDVAARYFALVSPLFSIEHRVAGGMVSGAIVPRFALDARVEQLHLDVILGSLYVQGAFLAGGRIPAGLELTVPHRRAGAMPAWVRDAGITITLEGDTVRARVSAHVLARPLLLADPKAHAAACGQCDELLAAMPMPDRTASEVRALLEQAGPPFPDFEAVARALGASSRTIRRRLDAEGVSFRGLLDEVRLGLAKRWLGRGDKPITAIGLELGYADSANFTRAFRRAFGQTPLAYQRGLRDPS